ncbi:hypothetical protein D3C86_1871290 [compost metagenome]
MVHLEPFVLQKDVQPLVAKARASGRKLLEALAQLGNPFLAAFVAQRRAPQAYQPANTPLARTEGLDKKLGSRAAPLRA